MNIANLLLRDVIGESISMNKLSDKTKEEIIQSIINDNYKDYLDYCKKHKIAKSLFIHDIIENNATKIFMRIDNELAIYDNLVFYAIKHNNIEFAEMLLNRINNYIYSAEEVVRSLYYTYENKQFEYFERLCGFAYKDVNMILKQCADLHAKMNEKDFFGDIVVNLRPNFFHIIYVLIEFLFEDKFNLANLICKYADCKKYLQLYESVPFIYLGNNLNNLQYITALFPNFCNVDESNTTNDLLLINCKKANNEFPSKIISSVYNYKNLYNHYIDIWNHKLVSDSREKNNHGLLLDNFKSTTYRSPLNNYYDILFEW